MSNRVSMKNYSRLDWGWPNGEPNKPDENGIIIGCLQRIAESLERIERSFDSIRAAKEVDTRKPFVLRARRAVESMFPDIGLEKKDLHAVHKLVEAFSRMRYSEDDPEKFAAWCEAATMEDMLRKAGEQRNVGLVSLERCRRVAENRQEAREGGE